MRGLRLFGERDPERKRVPVARIVRAAERFQLPFGPAALRVNLALLGAATALSLDGQLWNISTLGACVSIPGDRAFATPAQAQLRLRDPATRQPYRLAVQLRWISTVSHTTFVGLQFSDGALPMDIFLRDYMKASWTDGVRGRDSSRQA